MKAAVVHDAFTQLGGGERVAVQLAAELDAPLFAAAVRKTVVGPWLGRPIHTTFVQSLVGRGASLRSVAPLLPLAFARLDVGTVDVVVSSSSAFAHHVRAPRGAVHVCYCHTPPRFLWEPADYFRGHPASGALLAPAMAALRRLDAAASSRVDLYLANSRNVAEKIRRAYGREAVVVYPPTDTTAFEPTTERSGRFLVVSRLRGQKRIDLAVQAATLRGLALDVIGDGSESIACAGSPVRRFGSSVRVRTRRSGLPWPGRPASSSRPSRTSA